MLKITLGYCHPFKDALNGMCKFSGEHSPVLFHARKDDEQRDHRLAVYRDGVHIMTILDKTFMGCIDDDDPNEYYEILGKEYPEVEERGSLADVAVFFTVFQQTCDVEKAITAFYDHQEMMRGLGF